MTVALCAVTPVLHPLLYHTNLVARITHRHYTCLATVDDPGLRTIQESGQHNSFVEMLHMFTNVNPKFYEKGANV